MFMWNKLIVLTDHTFNLEISLKSEFLLIKVLLSYKLCCDINTRWHHCPFLHHKGCSLQKLKNVYHKCIGITKTMTVYLPGKT